MNNKVRGLWTTRLRSGRDKKIQGKLHNGDNCFCVLGILCDIYIREHPDERWDIKQFHDSKIQGENLILSSQVMEWAELDSNDPGIRIKGVCPCTLSDMNDSTLGYTFNQMADLIEEQL